MVPTVQLLHELSLCLALVEKLKRRRVVEEEQ